MQNQVRFYVGASFQSCALKREKTLVIGKSDDCDFRIPQDVPANPSGRIFYDREGWTLDYLGRQSILQHGAFISLHKEQKIALEFICNDGRFEQIQLADANEWHIGRNAGADISLPNDRVSSSHAKLYRHNSEWRLCDLNSTNGTYINGRRTQDVALREADEIAIGPYTLLFSSGSLRIFGGNVRLKPKAQFAEKRPASPEFNRSPRMIRAVPDGEVEIDAVPSIGSKPEINWLTALAPVLGTLLVSCVLMAVTGSMGMLMSAPMMLIGLFVTLMNYRSQTKKFAENEAELRCKYQAYLDEKEAQMREAARLQRDAECFYNPAPAQCLMMARQVDSRLFERTPEDRDFLSLRIGIGEEKLRLQIRPPKSGFVLQENALSTAAKELADRYRSVEEVPVLCNLLNAPVAGIVGENALTTRAAQALLVQLSTLHGSDDVRIAVIFSEKDQEQWMWTRWLPHVWNEDRSRRYVACGRYEAEELFSALDNEMKRRSSRPKEPWQQEILPHWVFLVADMRILPARATAYLMKNLPGISCIVLGSQISALPAGVQQIIEVNSDGGVLFDRNDPAAKRRFDMDQISIADCDAFARALAPLRIQHEQAEGRLPRMITLLEGYRAADPAGIEIDEFWTHSCSWKSLSVPIGIGAEGVYYFDIHEKHGGPHGLVAGSNGSGKSEMAQSWIASMALQFSPRDVNFLLVDFKGTSLLAPLKALPHLAGSISNLDRDVHRCLQALDYEIERRQRLVDQWNAHDILEYQKKCAENREMEPMPFLILVIDEFADFKAQFPDFTGALEHIFRGGRSLGVYTLIMTQKPAGVVTEQMYANARFRWCLKVMSESDSREMLSVNSAALIDTPGRCYIKTDAGVVDAVQPFYSGARYEPADARRNDLPAAARVLRNGARLSAAQSEEKSGSHGTQLEAVVQLIADHCRVHHIPGARKLWLPPLEEHIDLSGLLPQGRLWNAAADWRSSSNGLCAVIGKMDDPSRQEQRTLVHNFMSDGHLLAYGMPLSGKTTLLSTMAISLCNTYAPDQVQIYLMEFGGYALRTLECFPQVCGAGGDDEPEILAKIVRAFSDELKRRKQLFRSCGVGSFAAYREDENLPAWVLFVDNLSMCCTEFYELTEELVRISREGEAFGLYLASATTGTMGLNYQLSQNFASVIALQLSDSSDYATIVGRAKNGMPRRAIGRGLVRGPREFQTAIAFAKAGDRERAALLQGLAGRMRDGWHGKLPPKIIPLPDVIPYGAVQGEPIQLGLRLEDGQAAYLPLGENAGILASASDARIKGKVRGLFLRQICELEEVNLITNVPNVPADAQEIQDAQQWCSVLREIAPELRRRQAARKSGNQDAFEQIVILIDDLAELLESAPDELISRLEVFVRLGAGLNVTVIVLDLAKNMERLYFSGNILMETLQEHPMLLAGGNAETHRVADGRTVLHQAQGVLERGDWALIQGKQWIGVRPMESEG